MKHLIKLLLLIAMLPELALGAAITKVDDLRVNGSVKVSSTTKASRPIPVMSEAQRDAIASPENGDMIFNSDTQTLNQYAGGEWGEISGSGGGSNHGFLSNGGFEDGSGTWTISAGTPTVSTTDYIEGAKSLSISLSAVNGTIAENCFAPAATLQGNTLEHSLFAKTSLTTLQVCAMHGTTEANCVAVPATGNWQRAPLDLAAPSGTGNLCVRLKSTSSTTGTVQIDDGYVGLSRNLGQGIAKTPTVTKYTSGSGTYTPPAGVKYLRVKLIGGGGGGQGSGTAWGTPGSAGGTTSFGTSLLSATGGAAGNVYASSGGTGSVSSPAYGSTWPGGSGGAGNVKPTGADTSAGDGGNSCVGGGGGANIGTGSPGVAGGTNTGAGGSGAGMNPAVAGMIGAGGAAGGCVEAIIPNPDATYSYAVGAGGAGGVAGTSGHAGGNGANGYIEVTEYYDPIGQSYRPDMIAWRVDANIAGGNPDLGFAGISSYTEMTNSGLAVTQNTGSIAVGAVCSSTNASTVGALTCAAGNEGVGVTFNVPRAGAVKACFEFSHQITITSASGSPQIHDIFQIVETASNSQTILQEGKSRVDSGYRGMSSGDSRLTKHPIHICGTFNFTSAGQKTLRLMYEQSPSDSPTGQNIILADAAGTHGQHDIHITIEPIDQQVPAPLLVNSVVSNYSGVTRIESAIIYNNGSICGTGGLAQAAGWISGVTYNGTGDCSATITAGTFSGTPTCVVGSEEGSGTTVITGAKVSSVSTTGFRVRHSVVSSGSSTVSGTNNPVHVICTGPR